MDGFVVGSHLPMYAGTHNAPQKSLFPAPSLSQLPCTRGPLGACHTTDRRPQEAHTRRYIPLCSVCTQQRLSRVALLRVGSTKTRRPASG